MKKKVLIHSIVFSPDGVSTAYLYNDIALKFKANGYKVIVLTTTPHYNVLEEKLAQQPLVKRWAGLFYESDFKGIKVLHVRQKKFKSSVLRILGFLYWHILSFILGLAEKKVSIILSPSPPLTIGIINLMLSKLKGSKVIYNVQEIYPDFIINQGLKFRPAIYALKKMEQAVYNKSDAVTTIDPVFYQTILPRFHFPEKLSIIPNFVDDELFRPILAKEIVLNQNYFPEKKDVLKLMYAGNIGHAQDWEPLLTVAKQIRNEKIEFWVIGEGVMKDYLEQEIAKNNLNNIHLVPYQDRELMPSLIAYADLHFIFMAPEMQGQGFPSKVYTIMACAKPLLVISNENTPIHDFLNPLNCAFLVNSTNLIEKCNIIVDFLKSTRLDRALINKMGSNGYSVIEENYSKDVVSQKYVDLANKILTN